MIYKKKKIYFTLTIALILVIITYLAWPNSNSSKNTKVSTPPASPGPNQAQSFNKNLHSLSDPTSIWVVVNKKHQLNPLSYAPSDLIVPNVPLRVPGNDSMQVRQVIEPDLEQLFKAASAAGAPLMLSSGYRSYAYQVNLYGNYVKSDGVAGADTYSARPGFSEHQTGLAVDLEPISKQCDVEKCFADLPAGKWIAANAYKYGFILRYPADKVQVTGYDYEPWHLRYVGIDLSTYLHQQNIETLEEFFNLAGGPSY